MSHSPAIIIGAGLAGLTAAYELQKNNIESTVLEQADRVGGISRTETYKGYRFDIGGHRFFTKVGEVSAFWYKILGDEFIRVPRLFRIYYDGKFYDYPLSLLKTLTNLGLLRSALILVSYFKAKARKYLNLSPEAEIFEDWVIDCFGERLYQIFFKTYTKKVWGIPCSQIRAGWVAQRIKNMSLKRAVLNALFGSQNAKSLIKEFDYPCLSPGMMWERCQALVEAQCSVVHLNTKVMQVKREGNQITQVIAQRGNETLTLTATHFINTMPIAALVHRLDSPPPEEVLAAARGLEYRDFLSVSLIINRDHLFPDNWLYIHSPAFRAGRIQNFKNWSPVMVPEAGKTCLGIECFCSEGDDLGEMSEAQLVELATQETIDLNLGVEPGDVEDGCVIRQRKAHPVYDGEYRQHLQVLQNYISSFENLQTVGRNGMHCYNNQDHSTLTAMLAVKKIRGEDHDLWNINVERSYQENFTNEEWKQRQRPLKVAAVANSTPPPAMPSSNLSS